MRVLYILGVSALALALGAPSAPCQSLAEAAAREKERRKGVKPVKVITEDELRGGVRSGVPAPEGSADEAKPADGSKPADDKPKVEGKKEKTEEELRAEKAKDWKARVEQLTVEINRIQADIDRTQASLGDYSTNPYGSVRTERISRLETAQKSLAEAKVMMAALEEEGRRNRY